MKRPSHILIFAALALVFGGLGKIAYHREGRGSVDDRVHIDPSTQPARYTWVDAFIDPHGQPLAAYQFELKSSGGGAVTLVGVEGGEHPAFAPPPYYDPKANVQKRIVIAGFNTGDDLPHTRTRVARVMVRVTGNPKYSATLQVAASQEAKPIDAEVSVSEGAGQ
jgi:hypothetical protein